MSTIDERELGAVGFDGLTGPEGDGQGEGEQKPPENDGTPPEKGGGGDADKDKKPLKLTPEQQAEVDRLVGEARTKGREQGQQAAIADMLKQYNVETPDKLKEIVAKALAQEEAEKTEVQRLTEAQEREKTRAAELERQLQLEKNERLNDRKAVLVTGAAKDAVDIDDVLEQARKLPEWNDLIDKDGNPVKDKVSALVAAVRKAKPHYFKASGKGTPSFEDGEATPPNEAEARAAAQRQYSELRGRF